MTSNKPYKETSPDVSVIHQKDKEIILVGTAHISPASKNLVREIIAQEKPDHVCIELDANRYKILTDEKRFESLNILQIIKKKQLATLLVSVIVSSYQKKLGMKLGVLPGTELLQAVTSAQEHNIPYSLSDRDVQITLKRAFRKTPFFKKMYLFASIIASLFDKTEVTEETLEELKKQDSLTMIMQELAKVLPTVKEVLIDERDVYLSEKIKEAPGSKIMAVVGAGHVAGIKKQLEADTNEDLGKLETIPPASQLGKIIGWSIPAAIIAALIGLGYVKGIETLKDNIIFWIVANGSFSAAGALLALAHPLTIAAAFVAAPITSLTPVIGAGYVTAFVQVVIKPPRVRELTSVSEDIYVLKAWWQNRLLKVFLAFLLPGFGSMIGTYVGGYEIISNLF